MNITILYDAVEDTDKAEAEAEGQKISLVSEQIRDVLSKKDHDVKLLAVEADVRKLTGQLERDQSDLIFNLCESFGGVSQHEQHVAGLLEIMGKRFTGAASIGLTLAQDKGLSKKLFSFHGIPYPKFSSMDAGQVDWSDDLDFPLIVKPQNEDASIGIDNKAIVSNVKELMQRISFIHTEVKAPALIEEFIEGREIYVGVLGNDSPEALPILEWDFSKMPKNAPKIASSEAKWEEDSVYKDAKQLFPEDLPEPVVQKIQDAAIAAFKTLKLRDYGRVDMRLRPTTGSAKKKHAEIDGWEFFIIEVNPNPYLDSKAELAMAAAKHELQYPDLIQRIMDLALNRPR